MKDGGQIGKQKQLWKNGFQITGLVIDVQVRGGVVLRDRGSEMFEFQVENSKINF